MQKVIYSATKTCHYCGRGGGPLQKMQGFDSWICADGHGCQAEYVPSVRQVTEAALLWIAIVSGFVWPFVVCVLIWYFYL